MVAEDGSNGVWRGEIEGRSSIFIAYPFHESTGQKAGRLRKYESLWLLPLC